MICEFPTIRFVPYYISDKMPSEIYFLNLIPKFNSPLYRNVLFYCCRGGNLEVRELNFIIALRSTLEISAYALIDIAHWFRRN
jgi:hypothetical protein